MHETLSKFKFNDELDRWISAVTSIEEVNTGILNILLVFYILLNESLKLSVRQ